MIAIDDKLYKHHADIVFTNREFITKNINTYNNICFNGFKYALTSQIKKKLKLKKKIIRTLKFYSILEAMKIIIFMKHS